jgi:hypothetical protein
MTLPANSARLIVWEAPRWKWVDSHRNEALFSTVRHALLWHVAFHLISRARHSLPLGCRQKSIRLAVRNSSERLKAETLRITNDLP